MGAVLESRDFHRLLEILPTIYEAGDLTPLPLKVLRLISALIPADSWSYEECNPLRGRTVGCTIPAAQRETWGEHRIRIFEKFVRTHPIFDHWLGEGKAGARGSGAVSISDLSSIADWDNVPIYRELYHELDVEDQLGLLVAFPKPMMVAIAINRDRRSFTDRDRLILDLVQPHLQMAYRNADAFAALESAQAPRGRRGVITISSCLGTVEYADSAAALVASYFGGLRRSSRLPLVVSRWLGRIFRDPSTVRTVTRRGERGILVMRVFNQELGARLILLLEEHPYAVVPERGHPAIGALPPRLRQTLQALLKGKSTKEIAAEMKLSFHTASEHISRLYRQLGVNSRGELLSRFVRS